MSGVPMPMQNWFASLPQQNCGDLYAWCKPPLLPIPIKFKVEVWGQVCDGRPHEDAVHFHLWNHMPFHGRGWTYVGWEAKPDNPEQNSHPHSGEIKNPLPFKPDPDDTYFDKFLNKWRKEQP